MAQLCVEETSKTEVTTGSTSSRRRIAARIVPWSPFKWFEDVTATTTGQVNYGNSGLDVAISGDPTDGSFPSPAPHPVDSSGDPLPSGLSRVLDSSGQVVLYAEPAAPASDVWERDDGATNGTGGPQNAGTTVALGVSTTATFTATRSVVVRPKVIVYGFAVGATADTGHTAPVTYQINLSGAWETSATTSVDLTESFNASNGTFDLEPRILEADRSYTLTGSGAVRYMSNVTGSFPMSTGSIAVKLEIQTTQ